MKALRFIPLFLLFAWTGCQKEDTDRPDTSGEEFVPTDVLVKTAGSFTIDQVFHWINTLHLDVESIDNGIYTSDLPPDSLHYVLDYLNAKAYTHEGVWKVPGYVHDQTNKITIFPKLFQMNNMEHQTDWLSSMQKLQLVESSGNILFFHVPEGEEKAWVEKFKTYDFVEWAELNYIVVLNPWP